MNILVQLNQDIDGWRRYLGIIYSCMCSFGYCFVIIVLNKVFGIMNFSFINIFTGIIFPVAMFNIYFPTIIRHLKGQNIKNIALWSIIGILSIFLVKIISRFIENNLIFYLGYDNLKNFNGEQLSYGLSNSGIFTVFSIISICIIGPFIEEISYRICLFNTLKKKYKILSHIITAILFGFQHISVAIFFYNQYQQFLYIFSYIGFSLVLTLMYNKIRTPIPGIISHMFCNVIGCL